MAARIGIEASRVILTTTPGGEASQVALGVWHDGPAGACLRLTVQGLDPAWYCLTPAEFRLPPGEKGTARLEVCAPAEAALGLYAVTVVVTLEAVDVGRCPETTVAPVTLPLALWVEAADGLLFPVGGQGRRARVRFQNGRQAPWAVRLQAALSDEALDIRIEPAVLVVPPGGVAEAQLHVRPRHRAFTARAQPHRFTLAVFSAAEEQPLPLLQLPCEICMAPPPAFLACLAPVLLWPDEHLPLLHHALTAAWRRLKAPAARGLVRTAVLAAALLPLPLVVWLLAADGLGRPTAAPVASPPLPGATPVPSAMARSEAAARSTLVPPVISRFSAEPAAVTQGAAISLHWETVGAERLFLNGQPVAAAGTSELVPQSTGEYVLQAENAAGAVVQRLQVPVEVPVVEAVSEASAEAAASAAGPVRVPPRSSAPARQPPRARLSRPVPPAGAAQPVVHEAAQQGTEPAAPAGPPTTQEAQPPAPAPEAARSGPAPARSASPSEAVVGRPPLDLAPSPTPPGKATSPAVAAITIMPAEPRTERREAEPPTRPARPAASTPAPTTAPAQPPPSARSATPVPAPAATAPALRPSATRAPDALEDPCAHANQERCKTNDRQGPDRHRDGGKDGLPHGDREQVRSAASTMVRGAETPKGTARVNGRSP